MMVSIIITTYKRNLNIVMRAVNSVIKQTYKDWELFIVDDSPESYEYRREIQNTIENIHKCDNRVNYIAHSLNRGACTARNTGINVSKGKYIAFLDDDDEWLPEKIEKQVQSIEKADIDTAFVYCGCNFIDKNNNKSLYIPPYYNKESFLKLLETNYIGGSSFPLIRSSYLKEIGGFDEELLSSQDLDVWLRLSKHHKIELLPEALLNYYLHDGEQITKNIKKIINGREIILKKNYQDYLANKNIYWKYLMTYAYDCALLGEKRKTFSVYKKALTIKPMKILSNSKYLIKILYYLLKNRNCIV